MRVVFFGTGEFGGPTLRALAQAHQVVLVVSQPDRPRGRGQKVQPTAIAQVATQLSLPLFQPADINSAEAVARVAQAEADIGVAIAYGQKIGADVRSLMPHRCINLHASVLPRWRGAAPINWAILSGDPATGVTVFDLVDRMDAGPVYVSEQTPLSPDETADDLHDRLSTFGVRCVLDCLEGLSTGQMRGEPQDESVVTRARKLSKADSPINWCRPAAQIVAQIHGLWSWPCAQADLLRPLDADLHRPLDADLHRPLTSDSARRVGTSAPGPVGGDGRSQEGRTLRLSLARARAVPWSNWPSHLPKPSDSLIQAASAGAAAASSGVAAAGTGVAAASAGTSAVCGCLWTVDTVLAVDGVVELLEVKPAGKALMSWRAFAAGRHLRPLVADSAYASLVAMPSWAETGNWAELTNRVDRLVTPPLEVPT